MRVRRRYAAAKRSISCGIDGFMSALELELELASLLTRRLRWSRSRCGMGTLGARVRALYSHVIQASVPRSKWEINTTDN